MKQRTITAIIMVIVLVPFVLLGGWASTILFSVLAYVGTYELISMHKTKSNIPNICKYTIPLFTTMIVLLSGIDGVTLNDLLYIVIVQLMFLLVMPIFNKNILFTDVLMFIFAIIYCGLTFSLITAIRNIYIPNLNIYDPVILGFNINQSGLVMLIYVFFIVMFTDVFAYIFGIKFGKHRLCPTISPKKSVEGAISGTVFGAAIGTIILVLFREPGITSVMFKTDNIYLFILFSFLLSLVISIAGQLGDLIASKIKREYGIKDFGKIFPGHGGVLDRFDSSIYASIVFFVALMLLGVL